MRRLIVRAAWMPDCIATSATPGSPFSDIMSPTTNTSGCSGSVQSGSTSTCPARSVPAPVASASIAPSGEACTPADHTFVWQATRSSPFGPWTTIASGLTSVTRHCIRSSTPVRSISFAAFAHSSWPNVASGSFPPSNSSTCALAGSIRRKFCLSARLESSAICPAISTPVGPAPITANVSHSRWISGSSSISAISKAPKMRARSSRASSTVFIPGAKRPNSSCPKYEPVAPAATISES